MSKLLTKEGYLLRKKDFTKKEIISIKKDLTVEPKITFKNHQNNNTEITRFNVFSEDKTYLSIPKFYGLKKFGEPDESHEITGEKINIKFNGEPRSNQKSIIDQTLECMNDKGGGLICAGCGVGKTIMAIYIACYYKVKTLIIVHKTFLMNQWIDRIKEFTNTTKIGIIQQKKVEVDDNDFVIGMVHSIAKDKYDYDIFKDFGLVIFDEAHRAPSEYFSKALPIIACKKSLALSATPKRADGMEKVLYWYFGEIAYKAPPNKNERVMVHIYNYNLTHKNFAEARLPFTGEVNRPRTINRIVKLKKRNKFILDTLEDIMQEEGRKVLILSDRIEHLNTLYEMVKDKLNVSCDYYVGGMSQKKLDASSKCTIILGTYGMASEGLDIPSLNTLIMTTPRREVEQSIGRIIRKVGEIQPIIVDIVDMLPTLSRQGLYRRKLYNKLKYQMKIFEVENNNIMNEIDDSIINTNSYKPNAINVNDVDFLD